jgi:hypothetical protein
VVYFAGAGALRSPTIIARGSRSRRQARSLVHRRHHPRQRPRDIAVSHAVLVPPICVD